MSATPIIGVPARWIRRGAELNAARLVTMEIISEVLRRGGGVCGQLAGLPRLIS